MKALEFKDKKEKIRLALQKMATTTIFSKIDNTVLLQKKNYVMSGNKKINCPIFSNRFSE